MNGGGENRYYWEMVGASWDAMMEVHDMEVPRPSASTLPSTDGAHGDNSGRGVANCTQPSHYACRSYGFIARRINGGASHGEEPATNDEIERKCMVDCAWLKLLASTSSAPL
jgi:hypothetical protein